MNRIWAVCLYIEDSGDEYRLTLPFVPFVGLVLILHDDDADFDWYEVVIDEIKWSNKDIGDDADFWCRVHEIDAH